MREIHIGEIIKQRRLELGLTQEELCEGICEPPTMSRIEKGHQTPTHSKLKALLQRLGLPGEKFYAMMSKNELEIERLKSEIIASNAQHESIKVLNLLDKLTAIIDSDDHISQQFITRSRLLCGKMVDDEIIDYTSPEKIELLLTALKLTVPKFDIEEIAKNLYSFEEVKFINQIALEYSNIQEIDIALDIYYQLMKYIKKHSLTLSDSIVMVPLISYNYSRLLCMNKRPREAIKIAQIGLADCRRYGRAEHLPGLLFMLADSYRQIENIEEARERFLESFYTYRAMNDNLNAEIVREHVLEHMGIVI